ncbi:MAG: GHKL domain-containing protein [Cyclobacteriaceae bacterium]
MTKKLYKQLIPFALMMANLIGFGQEQQLDSILGVTRSQYRLSEWSGAIESGIYGLELSDSLNYSEYALHLNYILGDVYLAQGNFPKCIEHYINIIYNLEQTDTVTDYLADAYFALGEVYVEMNALGEAVKSYKVSYSHFRTTNNIIGFAEAKSAEGATHFLVGDFEKSIVAYKMLIDAVSEFNENRFVTGLAYVGYLKAIYANGDYEAGVKVGEQYKDLVELGYLESGQIWHYLSKCYFEIGEQENAIKYGIRALDQDRTNTSFMHSLGEVYRQNGEFDRSEEMHLKGLDLSQESRSKRGEIIAKRYLGHLYFDRNDYRASRTILREAENEAREQDILEELQNIQTLLAKVYEVLEMSDESIRYRFLEKEISARLERQQEEYLQQILRADNLAANYEQDSRLQIAELQKRKLAIEQEEQKVRLLQQEKTIQDQLIERQQLEALQIEQNLMIARQMLDAEKKDSDLRQLQADAELRALRDQENQQELELSNKEKLIFQQEAELQEAAIETANKSQFYLIIVIGLTLLVVGILIVFVIRLNRIRNLISHQNRVLEEKQTELQDAQQQLNRTLNKEKRTRKNLEKSNKDLKSAQSQLIHAEKMSSLGQLTAGIVHEINNPVNFVKGGIEILGRTMTTNLKLLQELIDHKHDNDEMHVILDKIREELTYSNEVVPQIVKDMMFGTNRIEEIVNGLRIFSRQDDVKPQLLNIHSIIDSALLILKSKTEEVAKVIKDYDHKIDPIECYGGQLNQVFVNIISNAIDAMEEGTIRICTKNKTKKVVVTIEDDGSGMTSEVKRRIFDPFYTTKEVGKGTGLGMSISYSIIQEHNGKISVESDEGKGTKFTIALMKKLGKNKPITSQENA